MSGSPAAPDGFFVDSRGRVTLLAKNGLGESLQSAGLHRVAGWQERLDVKRERSGRGSTAVVDLDCGTRLRIKQLRRGGATSSLWRDRFIGRRRLLDNLRIPLEAVARGVQTPSPLALMLVEGPPRLYRGWVGLEDVPDAVDLATRCASETSPVPGELVAALGAVRRMHDAGVEHRDLNLGNLLVRDSGPDGMRAYVIDLDRARLHAGALPFAARQAALRRLERSYVKCRRAGDARDELRDGLYSIYAADDSGLARRLAQGRRLGRGWIRVHRLGWRR